MVWVFVAILGLVLGSFLNMLIHRLPIMLEREWRRACADASKPEGVEARYDLVQPASACPACGHRLSWRENIPLLSFALQRGRCRHCAAPIAWRYPGVELAAAILVLAVFWRWPTEPAMALSAGVLMLGLLTLAVIDLETQLLPDSLTLGLLWTGLLVNLDGRFVSLPMAVMGAGAGYVALAGVAWLFQRLTGKEGMGLGDAKLLAALGAWLGWLALPAVVLLASVSGAVLGIVWLKSQGLTRATPIPFGPFLAVAGAVMFWNGGGLW